MFFQVLNFANQSQMMSHGPISKMGNYPLTIFVGNTLLDKETQLTFLSIYVTHFFSILPHQTIQIYSALQIQTLIYQKTVNGW